MDCRRTLPSDAFLPCIRYLSPSLQNEHSIAKSGGRQQSRAVPNTSHMISSYEHANIRALEFLNPDSSSWHIVDPSFADTSHFNALSEKKYRGLKPSHSKVVLPIYFHHEAHFGIAILDLAKYQLDLFEPLQSQKLYERMGSVAKAFVKCLAASNCFEGRTKPKKEWLETRSNTRLVQQNKVDCALYCLVNTLA
ncbi:hypothetical protein KC345_g5604 [Hortaea werneckii]|nr:hypothetical protein KC345_g5604 [Hortaea werneckii]